MVSFLACSTRRPGRWGADSAAPAGQPERGREQVHSRAWAGLGRCRERALGVARHLLPQPAGGRKPSPPGRRYSPSGARVRAVQRTQENKGTEAPAPATARRSRRPAASATNTRRLPALLPRRAPRTRKLFPVVSRRARGPPGCPSRLASPLSRGGSQRSGGSRPASALPGSLLRAGAAGGRRSGAASRAGPASALHGPESRSDPRRLGRARGASASRARDPSGSKQARNSCPATASCESDPRRESSGLRGVSPVRDPRTPRAARNVCVT